MQPLIESFGMCKTHLCLPWSRRLVKTQLRILARQAARTIGFGAGKGTTNAGAGPHDLERPV
jgi:hypothetical protein